MTGAEKTADEKTIPPKEEFFDAVRRHICQILGFDYGFIDLINGHEIINVASFSGDDSLGETKEIVKALVDENKQSILMPNTLLAQKVKQVQNPWVGAVYSKDTDSDEESQSEYPYAVVPIFAGSTTGAKQIKGLLRVLSFDASREINQQDLSTLKLMGEHLSTRMPQFEGTAGTTNEKDTRITPADVQSILIVHSNRVVRRRFSRTLSNHFSVQEADSGEKALELLDQNNIDLIVLDCGIEDTSGYGFCKALKESSQWNHIPIILVTSDSNPASKIEGLEVGAIDCLSESCFDLELVARVKSSLRHCKTERELAIQLQLLEDYAKRLEEATEKLSSEKRLQMKRNHELELLRGKSDILRNQEHLLHRISNTIRSSFNIEGNLREMLENLAGWLSLDSCFLVLPSHDDLEDSIRCEYFSHDDYRVREFDLDLKSLQVFQKHCKTDEALIVNDVSKDRRLDHFRTEALARHHALSLFYIPITYEEKLLGILAGFKCESVASWTKDNEAFLRSVADQIATGVTNARLYARVQRQATTDGLTALFNHRTGQEKLSEQLRLAERYQRNVAVIMLDVDHFKSINDSYGHPAGDTVLKAVAKLIQRDCRDVDLPVRYGGEEFLIVLPEVNVEGAITVAERIRKNLAQEPIHHGDLEIRVTASMGISAFPEDATNQQQLLDLADRALYLSKRLGRNQVHTSSDLLYEELTTPEEANPPKSSSEATPAPQTTPPPAASSPSADVPPPPKTRSQFVPPPIPPSVQNKEELVPEVVEMVKALASALYTQSEYNKVHHLETARMSELLAKVMGLSQQQIEQIRVAGLLHDVGTLHLPSDLLNKEGVYTKEEREVINQHPVLGADLLRPIRALRDICEILENHHERWDGTGFPKGLKAEEIPLPARIVSIVDSYHAMISERPYRKAMTPEEAIKVLKEGAGKQWDPFLVDIFVAVLHSSEQDKANSQTNFNPDRRPDHHSN